MVLQPHSGQPVDIRIPAVGCATAQTHFLRLYKPGRRLSERVLRLVPHPGECLLQSFSSEHVRFVEDLDVAVRSAGGGSNVNAVRGGLDPIFEDLLRSECIKYGDFTSLYPTCMITTDMCTGRPHVVEYSDNQPTQEKLKTFFGFITCSTLLLNED